jgi:hypothetical protein
MKNGKRVTSRQSPVASRQKQPFVINALAGLNKSTIIKKPISVGFMNFDKYLDCFQVLQEFFRM